MSSKFKDAQIQRLREVGADIEYPSSFANEVERDISLEEAVPLIPTLKRKGFRETASSAKRHQIQAVILGDCLSHLSEGRLSSGAGR
ncbi:MAG: hypothetical protein ABR986_08505 [Methanomassiliicoccales archaeon]|jgi:hypothetical protein